MSFSASTTHRTGATPASEVCGPVLAREAGVPYQPLLSGASRVDPIAEWLSLMEVVQMLCPTWPVRDTPMQGTHWRI